VLIAGDFVSEKPQLPKISHDFTTPLLPLEHPSSNDDNTAVMGIE
jgi:hypothetical protein